MIKGKLSRLFGMGPALPDTLDSDRLHSCLEFCDSVEKGLAARAVAYIETGESRSVLAQLQAKSQEIVAAFLQRRQEAAARDQTGRRTRHHPVEEEDYLRQILFRTRDQPQRVARMAEIAAETIMPGNRYQMHWHHNSVLSQPALFLLSSAEHTSGQDFPGHTSLSFTDFMAAAALHGATPDRIVASSVWRHWRARGMGIYGHKLLTESTVEDIAKGLGGLDASDRHSLLQLYRSSGLRPKGDCLPLWFELTTDTSSKTRDAARQLILQEDDPRSETMAIETLSDGKSARREIMVQILGEIKTAKAIDALKARLEIEKTRSVQLLIDQFLSIPDTPVASTGQPGYEAVDGSWITPPEVIALEDDGSQPFGTEDEQALSSIAAEDHALRLSRWETVGNKRSFGHRERPVLDTNWKKLIETCNTGKVDTDYRVWLYRSWLNRAITRVPPRRIARLWAAINRGDIRLFGDDAPTVWMLEQLESEAFDLRTVIDIADEVNAQLIADGKHGPAQGKMAASSPRERAMLSLLDDWDYTLAQMPDNAIWPLIADHLPMIAENLPPHELDVTRNLRALRLLGRLPAIPKALLPNLIAACTAEARSIRRTAQQLLKDVDGIAPQIVTALDDSRQAVRANAASFLGQRGQDSALPELIARLDKEQSEIARAAMISAVADLGGDTSKWLGREALEAEASTCVAKLKGNKIDWLNLDTAPALHWTDGSVAAADLLPGWLRLALKLKTLEDGAGLFALYLDQLRKEDAQVLGDWVLSAWIAHDSYRPPREELFRKQLEEARTYLAQAPSAGPYSKMSPEALASMWMSRMQVEYVNSGTASKGILALAMRATPSLQARLTGGYLKEHGRRTPQAKTLLELLALSGHSEGIQLVVATSTRFKRRPIREAAEQLVTRIAEERNWSADELADRSVPSGGFDGEGTLELPVGEDAKSYCARLGSDLALHLYNPDGREVKSLPAGKDENSKEARAVLSAAKKTVRTVIQQQAVRLHESMLSARSWSAEAWETDLRNHPIMGRLVERIIWRGLAEDGVALVTFRPTPEGDLLNAEGDDVSLDGVARIDIAHSATISGQDRDEWLQHIGDFEVEPLFRQLDRDVMFPAAEQRSATEINDRQGWMLDALKLRNLTAKLGYDQGGTMDGGSYDSYVKRFPAAGVLAAISFSGSYHGADNHPVALVGLSFHRLTRTGGARHALRLSDVPRLLLSECWNDWHEIAALGAFDPEWRKKGLW